MPIGVISSETNHTYNFHSKRQHCLYKQLLSIDNFFYRISTSYSNSHQEYPFFNILVNVGDNHFFRRIDRKILAQSHKSENVSIFINLNENKVKKRNAQAGKALMPRTETMTLLCIFVKPLK